MRAARVWAPWRHVAERLRANLWLLPSVAVAASIGLSLVTLEIDERFGVALGEAPYLFTGGPEGASAVLTAIAGSMMGVTGVIFSITVVALSLASTQFGPRLLRGFIRDRVNQVVLGVFLATFTFALLALRAIDREEAQAVPELTVNVAILLALASLGTLIYFVHHVATTIQADTIIAQVSSDLRAALEDLYPEEMGEDHPAANELRLPGDFEESAHPIRARTSGYVQAIDEERLLKAVVAMDGVLRLDVRPGDFVVEDDPVGWIAARGSFDPEPVASLIVIGNKPTPEQDAEFLVSQLVEVAVRALSPGINDPFTASRCADRISAALCVLSRRKLPTSGRADAQGRLRVVARRVTWEGFVDAGFDQLRQHAAKNVAVTMRLVEGLARIAQRLPPGSARAAALAAQADQIEEAAAQARFGAEDAREIAGRLDRLRRTLDADAAPAR